jgi:hypothetical protein
MLAVCIQHEMDHLMGKVFVEYLSPLKRNRIKTKLLKARARGHARGRERFERELPMTMRLASHGCGPAGGAAGRLQPFPRPPGTWAATRAEVEPGWATHRGAPLAEGDRLQYSRQPAGQQVFTTSTGRPGPPASNSR